MPKYVSTGGIASVERHTLTVIMVTLTALLFLTTAVIFIIVTVILGRERKRLKKQLEEKATIYEEIDRTHLPIPPVLPANVAMDTDDNVAYDMHASKAECVTST